MADNDTNDTKDPKPFIALATKILRDRGEKPLAAGMNPIVRRYLEEARKGYYRSPEEVKEALVQMEDDMVYEYFPEEYAQREAVEAVEAVPANQALEVEASQKTPNTPTLPTLPEGFNVGGRTRLL